MMGRMTESISDLANALDHLTPEERGFSHIDLEREPVAEGDLSDRKSTRLNSSHQI